MTHTKEKLKESSDVKSNTDFYKCCSCGAKNERSNGKSRLLPRKLEIDKDDVTKGLGKLVLTVVELIRELLERQAIRRMESDSLTDEEVDNLGTTFKQLNEKIEELKGYFGIEDDELNIDLGPLGKLL